MTDAHPSSIRFQPNSYFLQRCIRVSFTDRYDLGDTRFYFLSFFLITFLILSICQGLQLIPEFPSKCFPKDYCLLLQRNCQLFFPRSRPINNEEAAEVKQNEGKSVEQLNNVYRIRIIELKFGAVKFSKLQDFNYHFIDHHQGN